jgi:hypothetical protein
MRIQADDVRLIQSSYPPRVGAANRSGQNEFAKQNSQNRNRRRSAPPRGRGTAQRVLTRLTKGGGRNHLNEGPTSLVCLGNPPR